VRTILLAGALLTAASVLVAGAIRSDAAGGSAAGTTPPPVPGCADRNAGQNVRVTQDCGFRAQSEETLAVNPSNESDFVAASNDFRTGFNKTSIQWSVDGGVHWGDVDEPFQHKLNHPERLLPTPSDPNRHTLAGDEGTGRGYEHCSDPSVAWDSAGRVFYSCVAFDAVFQASLLAVAVSPPRANGSYFGDIGPTTRTGIVAEDNNSSIFHDKELLAADAYANSPNRDNVYIVWTLLPGLGDVFEGQIYASMSTDHGRTWSTPEAINGASSTLCPIGLEDETSDSSCDRSYAPAPAVLPNGDLAVVFFNHNLSGADAQYLSVHCRPRGSSPEGTAQLDCGDPTKVGDAVRSPEPTCDFGIPIECVPGPYVVLEDDPHVAAQPRNGHLYVVWEDYRAGEYDIELARSTDGGATWSAARTVNPDRGLDHYLPAVAAAPGSDGDRVGVSYYRSQRIPGENSPPPGGFQQGVGGAGDAPSDYVLAGGGSATALPWAFSVVSPPFAPPDQATFIGDYTGLAITGGSRAHPIWADTRNRNPYAAQDGWRRDLDVFTDDVALPDATAAPSRGTIGAP
jgi:hypothetical protein